MKITSRSASSAMGWWRDRGREISVRITLQAVVFGVLCGTATARAQLEFRDVTQEQGILHPAHTEHAFFDFNNDGLLDLLTDT